MANYFVSVGNQLAAAIISPANKKYPVSCHGPQQWQFKGGADWATARGPTI